MVNLNKEIAEWCEDPDHIKFGLRLMRVKDIQIPILRPVCDLCTDMKVYAKINGMSDEELHANVRAGKLHGLQRPVAVMENKVYHKQCLIKKIGQKKFDELITSHIIISE